MTARMDVEDDIKTNRLPNCLCLQNYFMEVYMHE